MNISEFERIIEYEFKNKTLLETALTHSSFGRDTGVYHENNERLEFLGDAFLDAIIGAELYRLLPDDHEGKLTKIRALIVCEKSLAETARKIDLGQYIRVDKGVEQSEGRNRDSILSDAMEAVIGAVYLDSDFETCDTFVRGLMAETVDKAIKGNLFVDYKSEIQEYLQKDGSIVLNYVTDKEEGPDHNKVFYMHLEKEGSILGSGSGKTKKEAEQNAAKQALEILKRRNR